MKKLAALLIGLVTFVGSSSVVHAAGAGTITLSPTSLSVQTGETVTLSVLVNPNGESIDTVRVELDYDPLLLEGVKFELGSQFSSLSPGYEIDNGTGLMNFGAFKYGDRVTTSGTMANVTFRALSSGTALIDVTDNSKLINNGEEKVNVAGLGSASLSLSGTAVAPTSGGTTPAPTGTLEEQALVYFGAFAGRLPSSSVDWEALHCIAYDTCKPTVQNVEHEQTALVVFGEKYGHLPVVSMDWSTIHALAYTNVFFNWDETSTSTAVQDEPVPVVEEATPVVEESTETTTETTEPAASTWDDGISADEAIGIFGQLTGRLPSTSQDWTAVDYMQHGYKPAVQDTAKEQQAIALFGSVFGRMPSTSADWNVVAAIAYSGAIL